MTAKICAAFVKAQAGPPTPESRMAEAVTLKRLIEATAPRKKTTRGRDDLSRLLQSVAMGASDCWYWNGFIDDLGYGRTAIMGESKAHRASYRIFRGGIPVGLKVLHSCDTRCCVNPDHLRLGTQAENVADMMGRGRNRTVAKSGEDNPMAKATTEMVSAIRRDAANGERQVTIARRYGLSPMSISRIVRRKSWN